MALQYLVEVLVPLLVREATEHALKYATRRAAERLLVERPAPRGPRLAALGPVQVVSDTPGRLRLRVPREWLADGGAALVARCTGLPGVLTARVNRRTASLLLAYRGGDTTRRAVWAALGPPRPRSTLAAAPGGRLERRGG
ncbi:MAG TPA: hypothetical protein VKZ60_01780 [Chloroflexota bacterium]|jgi:hypothetical protein|nr:hypothetical protein [Chloroflexota bacterium]